MFDSSRVKEIIQLPSQAEKGGSLRCHPTALKNRNVLMGLGDRNQLCPLLT